jgi:hypothetical protein
MFGLDGAGYRRAIEPLLVGGEGFGNCPLGPCFYVMSELLSAAIVQR